MSPPSPRDIKQIPALRTAEAGASAQNWRWKDTAILEAKQLGSGRTPEEFASDAAKAEHERTEHFRDHFERIAIWAMYALSAVFAVVAFTWVFNLVAPEGWHYATEEQVTKLQNILTGGIIGVLLAHMKRRIGG